MVDFINEELDLVGDDFNITQVHLVGGRITKTAHENSDLDVAFEYEGKYREDTICDILNEGQFIIEGFRIDFIPYSIYKGSSIESGELRLFYGLEFRRCHNLLGCAMVV